ncbi:MAG: hypothetical protein KBT00_00455 [Bacteroidales bacterium]|nr:hypothetical protein [Candidatus Cacconaster merdequi]
MSWNDIRHTLLAALLCIISMPACKPVEDTDSALASKIYLRDQLMDHYYFWREEVKERNTRLSPGMYSMEEYFDALLYSRDRWSWMEGRESYISSFTGVTEGGTYAVSTSQAVADFKDYRVWVKYILPGSPLERYGVTRGALLTSIGGVDISGGIETQVQLDAVNNGFSISPQTFSFRLADGTDTTFTTSWSSKFATDYILKDTIFTGKDFPGLKEPVGYLNFISFSRQHISFLAAAIERLHEAGIRKLILDLRYNGGGDATVSDTLMSYIAPAGCAGKVYVKRIHNGRMASHNKEEFIKPNDHNLNLDAIYFIGGKGMASASEMVFNALKPYFKENIHLVGRSTYGKPNGMYVLLYPDSSSDYDRYNSGDYSSLQYAFYPVSFFNSNSSGNMIPEEGFTPERVSYDDIFTDFNPMENDIAACLHHIVNGSYPSPAKVSGSGISVRGMEAVSCIPEENANPFYGIYKVHLLK